MMDKNIGAMDVHLFDKIAKEIGEHGPIILKIEGMGSPPSSQFSTINGHIKPIHDPSYFVYQWLPFPKVFMQGDFDLEHI